MSRLNSWFQGEQGEYEKSFSFKKAYEAFRRETSSGNDALIAEYSVQLINNDDRFNDKTLKPLKGCLLEIDVRQRLTYMLAFSVIAGKASDVEYDLKYAWFSGVCEIA